MPATRISDLIIPEILRTDAQVNLAKLIDFTFGGAAERGPVEAGDFVNIRKYNQLTGDADRMVEEGSYSINNLSQLKDVGVILHRIKNFGAEDLAVVVSGSDPMAAASGMLSHYWMRQMQNAMLRVLGAHFTASTGALVSTNEYDVYNAGTPVYLTPTTAAAGLAKIGDEMMTDGVWIMHSAVYAYLLGQGFTATVTNPQTYGIDSMGNVTTFMNRRIIVSDQLTALASGKYRTFFCAAGSMFFGIQKDLNPEMDRDAKNKLDFIATDFHFCAHVRGVKWNVATTNPTDTVLGTSTSWTLAYDDAKFCRVVSIVHNG